MRDRDLFRVVLLSCIVFAWQTTTATHCWGEPPSAASNEALAKFKAAIEKQGLVEETLEQDFAQVPLTRDDAKRVEQVLWQQHVRSIRRHRKAEMSAQRIELDGSVLRFDTRVYGKPPSTGRSLYLSLHGGGGAPARVNDQQWENQKRLYRPDEGIYIAPRAPSNQWDLWHREPVGRLLDRLIENLIVLEDVNPNRVYLMGYSAGGDGVYQLAPRMADRWAAAAMMAGHPNDASPLGLRNLGFVLQVGGLDRAYDRNKIAASWQQKLTELRQADAKGYPHLVKIYPDKGHWMDREDAMAVPWMAHFNRNPLPNRIVWKQDNVTRGAFYWLAADGPAASPGTTTTATRTGRQINVTGDQVDGLSICLNDQMGSLDETWTIHVNGQRVFQGIPQRTIARLAESLRRRGDPHLFFAAKIDCGVSAQSRDDGS